MGAGCPCPCSVDAGSGGEDDASGSVGPSSALPSVLAQEKMQESSGGPPLLCSYVSHKKINETAEPGSLSPASDDAALLAQDDRGDPEATKKALVARVERLVDTEYDIIKAEALLADLEALMGSSGKEWTEMIESPLFGRFRQKLDIFHSVGSACCANSNGWFCAYQDAAGMQSIHGRFDPHEQNVLHYRVRVQIPARLTNILAVANEIQLMPKWNSLVVNQPQVIGRRTAHYMVLQYQMSVLGGMYKLEMFNEVRRFSDPGGGFLAEYIQSVSKDHPAYRPPRPGFKRPETQVSNCWVACGPEHSVLIQAGRLKLPFGLSKWLVSSVGSIAGKYIIGGLVKNSLRSTEPGNPWQEPLAEDSLGLYCRLAECSESPNSLLRRPFPSSQDARVGDFDLRPFFERRRIRRTGKEDVTPKEDNPQPRP